MHWLKKRTLFKRQQAKGLFIRYGLAGSEAMFDFPYHVFQIPECEGIITYRLEHGCAIVFGDPICPPHELLPLSQAFLDFCKTKKLTIIYVIISKDFYDLIKDTYPVSMEVCEEFIINPADDPCQASSRMRHRVKQAEEHGLNFHEYIPFDEKIEARLKEIALQWKKAIKGPNIYLGHLDFFDNYTGKRWFYIKDKETITSMAMLSKLEAKNGWLLKFLITSPEAVHNTSEFLMTSLIATLKGENCKLLSKGMVPAQSLSHIQGLRPISTYLAKQIYRLISRVFKFEKRKEYWLRYNPRKEPTYLVMSSRIGLKEIRALISIFYYSYSNRE